MMKKNDSFAEFTNFRFRTAGVMRPGTTQGRPPARRLRTRGRNAASPSIIVSTPLYWYSANKLINSDGDVANCNPDMNMFLGNAVSSKSPFNFSDT